VSVSELLPTWDAIKREADWTGLLVGNGASIAVSPAFHYDSLYDIAGSGAGQHRLSEADVRLFDALETKNFERVLSSLKTTGLVGMALGLGIDSTLEVRYSSIQTALFDAVHTVHVPWEEVSRETVPSLFDTMREYRYVFSTNYDLLLYWAAMHDGGRGFLDFLWNGDRNEFSASRTSVFDSFDHWTRVLFLHGGIHLRRLRGGGTRKVVARDGALLEQFETQYSDEESPLLVSEGESAGKLESIASSDYLSFAFEKFATHEGGLVVFGHSLSDQDDHLVKPLKRARYQPIAISMLPDDDEERLIQEQDRLKSRVSPRRPVHFFDATTHPLGSPTVRAQRRSVFGRTFGRR
jgi:hypothetical protein